MSNNLETKKKLLVAEAEVYRQLLKLEIQTFKVYGMRTKRRMTSFSSYMPLLMSGLPFLTRLFRRNRPERFSLQRMGALFLLGWKAYRRFSPIFSRFASRAAKTEPKETAAEEYLAKRL